MKQRVIPFIKMHGAGNDFVFLTPEMAGGPVTPALARLLLDRHFGVGGDQLILLKKGSGEARFTLDFFNSDGSKAEMCGNGTRAAASYLNRFRGVRKDFSFRTLAGLKRVHFSRQGIEVDMGQPILEGRLIPVRASGPIISRDLKVGTRTLKINAVSMGNPHAVIFVKDVKKFPVHEVGPLIENHPFFPKRVNVEFVQVLSSSHVRARVWERGAGETLACGTGACAIVVASARMKKTGRTLKIDLPGGQLRARWAEDNRVYLSGPAAITYEGKFFTSHAK